MSLFPIAWSHMEGSVSAQRGSMVDGQWLVAWRLTSHLSLVELSSFPCRLICKVLHPDLNSLLYHMKVIFGGASWVTLVVALSIFAPKFWEFLAHVPRACLHQKLWYFLNITRKRHLCETFTLHCIFIDCFSSSQLAAEKFKPCPYWSSGQAVSKTSRIQPLHVCVQREGVVWHRSAVMNGDVKVHRGTRRICY